MRFLLQLILSGLAILACDYFLDGVQIDQTITAFVVAAVLAFLNAVLRPVLVFFTIPISIFTLGFFLIVINVIIVLIAAWLVNGFHISTLRSAFAFVVLNWLLSFFINGISREYKKSDD